MEEENLTTEQINKKINEYGRSKRICVYSLVGGVLMFTSPFWNLFSVNPSYPANREYNKLKSSIEYIDNSIKEIKSSKLEKLSLLNPDTRKIINELSNQRKQSLVKLKKLKKLAQEERNLFYNDNRDIIDEYEQNWSNGLINEIAGGCLMIFSMLNWAFVSGRKEKYKQKYEKLKKRFGKGDY